MPGMWATLIACSTALSRSMPSSNPASAKMRTGTLILPRAGISHSNGLILFSS